jgi:hypothetical protein
LTAGISGNRRFIGYEKLKGQVRAHYTNAGFCTESGFTYSRGGMDSIPLLGHNRGTHTRMPVLQVFRRILRRLRRHKVYNKFRARQILVGIVEQFVYGTDTDIPAIMYYSIKYIGIHKA